MPISSAASRSLAVVGMMPWLPTPTGMWSNSDCSQEGRQRKDGQIRTSLRCYYVMHITLGLNVDVLSASRLFFPDFRAVSSTCGAMEHSPLRHGHAYKLWHKALRPAR
jgi:hypothetical protein